MEGVDERIPVVDLFSGPGGLGEGFSRFPFEGDPRFQICVSIEKEENAHRTLMTRAFFRQFAAAEVPEAYYEHLRGRITQEELFGHDDICRKAAEIAKKEAHRIELGDKPGEPPDPEKRESVRKLIAERVKGHPTWVLIGGPPCQAYSLAGRSRMLGVVKKDSETAEEFRLRKEAVAKEFEKDHRHLLYREYLSIIADHWPPVFVMENVKGLLSAKLDGRPVFEMIRDDLKNPNTALGRTGLGYRYRIFSLCASGGKTEEELEGKDYLIKAEDYGVPQNRHRVILLGVREDLPVTSVPLLTKSKPANLSKLLSGLPELRPVVSKGISSNIDWVMQEIPGSSWIKELEKMAKNEPNGNLSKVQAEILETVEAVLSEPVGRGKEFTPIKKLKLLDGELGRWLADPLIGGVCNHVCRSHMGSDLHRYLFASAFAKVMKRSPKLKDFPESLLPDHSNVKGKEKDLQKFADRFKVQLGNGSAATITCHISQDGHANIHPDPMQVRSLTVREAARIQTFPDNYFFEGSRTAQYKQVGNAVPPFLAHQIAAAVAKVFEDVSNSDSRVNPNPPKNSPLAIHI